MKKLNEKEFIKVAKQMLTDYVAKCIENGELNKEWKNATIQFQPKKTNSWQIADRLTICASGDTEFAVYNDGFDTELKIEDISA